MRSTPGGRPDKRHAIYPHDHLIVFVVRSDGEPGLYVADGVTADQVSQLLTMMAEAVKTDPRMVAR